jgi:biopolymer transport protein ExbD
MRTLALRFCIAITLVFTIFSSTVHSQQPSIPEGAVVVNLDMNGALRLDQKPIDVSRLADRLHDISATRNEPTVVIVAAANVPFKELVNTVEAVRHAGIERVGILKSQEAGPVKQTLPPAGATVLSVDRSGVIRLDGKKTKIGGIEPRLRNVLRRRKDNTVYIEAYGALSFNVVDNVIDAAKAAGANRIALIASSE